ncbi:MAG: hypothetical protein JXB48_08780 [Candidatus Latescibacteria bacterium]|nr:hypothetical protein [Candidatus Latescibacterota bacterium]
MDIRKKEIRWIFLFSSVLLLATFSEAFGQLLFKPEMDREFYGREGYHRYGRSIVNRSANPKYDSFGNYLLDGVRIFEWNEEKINSQHVEKNERFSKLYKTNPIDEGEYFRQYLNNLVVVHETTKTFSTRFIIGNEVRAKFSPLVLDMAALNGVRWDMNFYNNNLTFVSSRADLPLWFSRDFVNDEDRFRQMPVYLTGGHYERAFGIFNVAANYVNQYKTDSTQARHFSNKQIISDVRDSVTGQISFNPEPVLMLVVKLEDGSRHDGKGPRLLNLVPIIEGVEKPELLMGITRGNWRTDFTDVRRLFSNPAVDFYENVYMLDPKRVPQFVLFDQHNMKDLPEDVVMRRTNRTDPILSFTEYARQGTLNNQDYFEVNGEDYLQFWFEIPPNTIVDEEGNETVVNVQDVQFKALVGNDYKFSISEIYQDNNQPKLGKKGATYFYPALESPGNVQDMSNLDVVYFRYGQQTADMIMGLRVDAHVKGFDLVAEFNKNLNWRQYPSTDATKYRQDAEAYFVNVQKQFGKFTIGTEYFKIEPGYTTTFQNMDRAYYFMNTLPYSSWTNEFNADVGLRGGSDSPNISSSSGEYMNNTMVMETVDDNDDKDRFPDFHMFSEVRDRDGIYPGLDKNGNTRPDTNENGNLIPDYMEPFFLYNVDPDEWEYGDDFNQNGVIDSREDDDKPDYPYDKDTKGYHVFSSYGGDLGLKYTLGYIDYEQIAGGGKTDVRYGKIDYRKFIPFFATINLSTQLKKAEDTIQDNVFRHATQLAPATLRDSLTYEYNNFYSREGLISEKYYDQLYYKDSYVSTSYFETNLFRVPNLNIGLKFKYDLNHQNETLDQDKNDIVDRTQVVKADYKFYANFRVPFINWRINNLVLQPQVKFLSRKLTSTSIYDRTLHEEYFYPIFRLEYPLTMNTTLKAGAQGFPFLNSTVRNLVNSELDYDTRDYLVMFTNRSLYNGYDFSLNFGYQINWQEMKGIMRAPYSTTDKIFFIRLVVGMEPIS